MVYADRTILTKGLYPAVYWPDHPLAMCDGTVYVHRAEALEKFGEIPTGHHVHHKDENKWNWDKANLDLIPAGEHAAHHNKGISVVGECATCGRRVESAPSIAAKGRGKYCSKRCSTVAQQKIDWPDVSRLSALVRERGCSGAGRVLGVSNNAIKKRLKKKGAWPIQ